MSEETIQGAVPFTVAECKEAPVKSLSFLEGVAMIVGTNIGAGILSIAYAARKAGFMSLLFWLIVAGILTTITERYVGALGSWIIFAAVCVNSMGALIAYMSGSGELLNSLAGLPRSLGSLIFFIPAAGILWLGLKAIGRSEKVICICMVAMLAILFGATLLNEKTQFVNLMQGNWIYMIPVFNVVVFCFSAQYIVPEMARGFSDKPEQLPKAIITGMVITFILLAAVPMSVIALSGLDNITQVATLSWGKVLGNWAFFSANLFALFAMLTSYWGLGGSLVTNIGDRFKLAIHTDMKKRLLVMAIVTLPPFLLAYSGMVSFVNALYIAGTFSGVVLSIMPMLILKGARARGDIQPSWTCSSAITHPGIKILIILIYFASAVYAIAALFKLLPAGW